MAVYFVQPSSHRNTDVHKVGCSSFKDGRRFKCYGNSVVIIRNIETVEFSEIEKCLKDEFKKKFELQSGTQEFFRGNTIDMIESFDKITQNWDKIKVNEKEKKREKEETKGQKEETKRQKEETKRQKEEKRRQKEEKRRQKQKKIEENRVERMKLKEQESLMDDWFNENFIQTNNGLDFISKYDVINLGFPDIVDFQMFKKWLKKEKGILYDSAMKKNYQKGYLKGIKINMKMEKEPESLMDDWFNENFIQTNNEFDFISKYDVINLGFPDNVNFQMFKKWLKKEKGIIYDSAKKKNYQKGCLKGIEINI